MHIAEIRVLKANESRVFNISLNGELWGGPYIPKYLHTTTVYSPSALKGGKFEFVLYKIEQSTLPPLINAIEVYKVVELLQSQTDQQDGKLFIMHCFSLTRFLVCPNVHDLNCHVSLVSI